MATRETDRVNTRPGARVTVEDVPENCFTASGLRHVPNLLLRKLHSLVDEYSEQIEWWTDNSKTVVFISFLYSLTTLELQNGLLMAMTGVTLTSGFAVVFCLCRKLLTTNFRQFFERFADSTSRDP